MPDVQKTIPDEIADAQKVSIGDGVIEFVVEREIPQEIADAQKVSIGERGKKS